MKIISLSFFVGVLALSNISSAASVCPRDGAFRNPQPVPIIGYEGEATEPFLSRDGRYLFFNNRNDPADKTDLHFAEFSSTGTLNYRGKLVEANSLTLDAVPSMDSRGSFFFISTRDYFKTLNSVFTAGFADGQLMNVQPLKTMATPKAGKLIFDLEVSADGKTLYYADGVFSGGGLPDSSTILFASKGSEGFKPTLKPNESWQTSTTACDSMHLPSQLTNWKFSTPP